MLYISFSRLSLCHSPMSYPLRPVSLSFSCSFLLAPLSQFQPALLFQAPTHSAVWSELVWALLKDWRRRGAGFKLRHSRRHHHHPYLHLESGRHGSSSGSGSRRRLHAHPHHGEEAETWKRGGAWGTTPPPPPHLPPPHRMVKWLNPDIYVFTINIISGCS